MAVRCCKIQSMKFLTTPHAAGLALKPNGFTLIELMITVAIVGILASIAYPSYMSQVRKSRRSDAVQALSQLEQAQERWRANNATYASDSPPNSQLTTAWPAGLGIPSDTSGGYYTLAITGTPTGTAYTATATAKTGKSQASDTNCTILTVTITNGTATNTPTSCWSK